MATRGVEDDEGGDSACWMHLVCQRCGAMSEENPPPERCPHCGEERA